MNGTLFLSCWCIIWRCKSVMGGGSNQPLAKSKSVYREENLKEACSKVPAWVTRTLYKAQAVRRFSYTERSFKATQMRQSRWSGYMKWRLLVLPRRSHGRVFCTHNNCHNKSAKAIVPYFELIWEVESCSMAVIDCYLKSLL